jgi:hypothetical protein
MESSALRSRVACAAVTALLVANVLVPLVWGDVYPFTSAPMFRDSPEMCCNYQVLDADGSALPADQWLVQRIYDGNPIGYGVGIHPPPVIEQQFGVVHDDAIVRHHFERQLAERHTQLHPSLEVVQQVIGPIDGHQVGVMRTERWRIGRR